MMERIFAIFGGVVLILIVMLALLVLLDKHTSLFWLTCKVCKRKRKMFFYVGETNARYNPELDGCKIGDIVLKGGGQVCTHCCKEHKLFDNYK